MPICFQSCKIMILDQVNVIMYSEIIILITIIGIVNKTSLKIYNDPFNYFSFLKCCLSGMNRAYSCLIYNICIYIHIYIFIIYSSSLLINLSKGLIDAGKIPENERVNQVLSKQYIHFLNIDFILAKKKFQKRDRY